jgi:hypothetical protein
MSEILGAFFGALLGLMMMPRVMAGIATERQIQMDVNTAQQQQAWVTAVSSYVSANMTTLEATATATSPVTVSVATVTAAGIALPTGFNGINPFNQTWTAQVKQPTAGTLQVLVYATGGTTILDQELGNIARSAGGIGGFIPSNNSHVYASGAATAFGAFGSWTVPTANYANITGGHPASLLNFSNGTLTSNFLYRNAVPGQPQLNVMNTNLGLNNNNITGANQISTNTLVAAAGNGVQIGSSFYYGDTANSAIRQSGALFIQNLAGTAAANLNVGSVAATGNITATGSFSAGGTATVGSNLQVNGSATVNGNQTIGASLQVNGNATVNGTTTSGVLTTRNNVTATAATVFQGNGCAGSQLAVSVDGTGQWLQCKSGVWHILGGFSTYVIVTGPQEFGFSNSIATCPAGFTLLSGGGEVTDNPLGTLPGMQAEPVSSTQYVVESTDARIGVEAVALCGE